MPFQIDALGTQPWQPSQIDQLRWRLLFKRGEMPRIDDLGNLLCQIFSEAELWGADTLIRRFE